MESNNEHIDLLVPPDLDYLIKLSPPVNLFLSEGLALCMLASKAMAHIVEVGSYMGKSACFMAAGSRMGTGQHITCIDPWDLVDKEFDHRNEEKLKTFARPTIRGRFDEQTRPYKDTITPIQGYSEQIARTWDRPIGLIFIDGYHSETKIDFDRWYSHMIKGGVMAFHDIHFPHVLQQIKEIKETRLLKHWITINRLVYAEVL